MPQHSVRIATHSTNSGTTMENISVLENLIVRACKSRNSKRRLHSVLTRFYWIPRDMPFDVKYSRVVLSNICEKYDLITLSKFVSDYISRENMSHLFGDNSDDDLVTEILISSIRLSPIAKFPGYRAPLYFRRTS